MIRYLLMFFYIPIGNEVTRARIIHRVTLTRRQSGGRDFGAICFVDGEVVYMRSSQGGPTFLINSDKWNSGYGKLGNLWFSIGSVRIDVRLRNYLWYLMLQYDPRSYEIAIDDTSTHNGKSIASALRRDLRIHYAQRVLFPLFLLYGMLVALFVVVPGLCCRARPKFVARKFRVVPSDGGERMAFHIQEVGIGVGNFVVC